MAQTNPVAVGPRTAEGTAGYKDNPTKALRRAVLTSLLWEDKFYESGKAGAARIAELVPRVDPQSVANIAVEARSEMQLRHAPLHLLRELVRTRKAGVGPIVRKALATVIQRPDELAEFLAIYWKDKKQPLAASVKKGLADAFGKFNAYQLAKYNNLEKAIKLRDVLFLCHAKPTASQAAMWKQLIDGTLPTPDTWETQLSAGADKKETFERLMKEGKLGGLATLRNLRNMLAAKVDTAIIRERLAAGVERALPFRFIAAARYAPQLEDALEAAMLKALNGHLKLPGTTALIVDRSGSMNAALSAKSDMTRVDAANGLAILLREVCERCNVYVFGDTAARVPARRGFALRDAIMKEPVGGSSKGGLAVQLANTDGYDRIVVLTDGQWHEMKNAAWVTRYPDNYKNWLSHRTISPAPISTRAYFIDICGYEVLTTATAGWEIIPGWSERVVDYIFGVEMENWDE